MESLPLLWPLPPTGRQIAPHLGNEGAKLLISQLQYLAYSQTTKSEPQVLQLLGQGSAHCTTTPYLPEMESANYLNSPGVEAALHREACICGTQNPA